MSQWPDIIVGEKLTLGAAPRTAHRCSWYGGCTLSVLGAKLSSTLRIFARLVQTPAQKIDASETMRTACSTRAAVRRLRQTTRVKTALAMSQQRYKRSSLTNLSDLGRVLVQ